MNLLPRFAFFVAGTGAHPDKLHAFEKALLNAGPICHNLVTVSSILPADCKIIPPEKGFDMLGLGAITFCVMAREDSNVPDSFASASVGVVKEKKQSRVGYLSEYHGNAEGEEATAAIGKRLAYEMFETKFGISTAGLNLEQIEGATVSIQHPGGNIWVSAVALCFFVL